MFEHTWIDLIRECKVEVVVIDDVPGPLRVASGLSVVTSTTDPRRRDLLNHVFVLASPSHAAAKQQPSYEDGEKEATKAGDLTTFLSISARWFTAIARRTTIAM